MIYTNIQVHWKVIFLYLSMFCPGKWIQKRVGWWSSRQRSKAPAWTRTCPKRQWTETKLRRWHQTFWFHETHPDEEVDHEEDVEGEVDLLGRVLNPGGACFHTIPESREIEPNQTKSESELESESEGSLCPQPMECRFSCVESFEGEHVVQWTCQQNTTDDQFHCFLSDNGLTTLKRRWSRWWETRWRGWRPGTPANWNNTKTPSLDGLGIFRRALHLQCLYLTR